MRLYSSVIKLINQYPVTIPPPGAQHAHAAFFHILKQVDLNLASKIHEIEGKGKRKPFTISPIMGLPEISRRDRYDKKQGFELFLEAGWECWLRVTLLDETLFHSFIEYFLCPSSSLERGSKGSGIIRLGAAHFLVSEILTIPSSHSWAGFTSIEDLQKRLDDPPPESIIFELHTPTSFKTGNIIELIPYPKLAFGNLATAWKNLSGENHVETIEKYAQNNLRLMLHRLDRRALVLHNQPQLGSTGKVEYLFIKPEDTLMARYINLLAGLAFYSGLGRKTAQGMGMCRQLI